MQDNNRELIEAAFIYGGILAALVVLLMFIFS